MTIHLDLANLTQAHVDEAARFAGRCTYASPCVLGAMMTRKERRAADTRLDATDIVSLVRNGLVTLPPEQLAEAAALQNAFDSRGFDTLRRLLARRGLVWPAA